MAPSAARVPSLLFVGLVVGLVTACTATRSPLAVEAPSHVASDPSVAGDDGEDSAEADADGAVEATDEPTERGEPAGPCPRNMVLVIGESVRVCVDKYEASLVEIGEGGTEKAYPHWLPVDGHMVRAVSEPGVFPQGYISEVQAEDACAASGKRLCSYSEWKTACMGSARTTFPYGDARQPGACHDTGKSAVGAVFGMRAMSDPVAASVVKANRSAGAIATNAKSSSSRGRPAQQVKGRAAITTKQRATATKATPSKKTGGKAPRTAAALASRAAAKASTRPASVEPSVWSQLNDPRLGQVEGALAKTGSHEACVNGFGLVDMVGNIHEWVRTSSAAPHGTFAGGYYLDTALNGDGCQYRTTAHAHDYHDYSTGFRCCAEPQ